MLFIKKLLQSLFDGNSDRDSHANHGGATGAPPVADKATGASGSDR